MANRMRKLLLACIVSVAFSLALVPMCAWAAVGSDSGVDLAAGSIQADSTVETSAAKKAAFTKQTTRLSVATARGMAVDNGVYIIASARNTQMLVGAKGSGATLQGQADTKRQKWKFTFDYWGQSYKIVNVLSGEKLTVQNGGVVLTKSSTKSPFDQLWTVHETATGFVIYSRGNSSLKLTIGGSKPTGGAKVTLAKSQSTAQQKYWLFNASSWTPSQVLKNGSYTIKAPRNGFLLTIPNMTVGKEAHVRVSKNAGNLGQVFDIKHVGNGYYTIVNVNSNMAVTAVGTKVVQRPLSTASATAQRWKAQLDSDGKVRFINQRSGRALGFALNNKKAACTKSSAKNTTQTWVVSPQGDGLSTVARKALYRANTKGSKTDNMIVVDLTAHELMLFEKVTKGASGAPWQLKDSWRISCGRNGKTKAYYGRILNKHMYHGGYVNFSHFLIANRGWFHTVQHAAYNPNRVTDGRVGYNISNGCVRSPVEKAKYMYKYVPIGTSVWVYYK